MDEKSIGIFDSGLGGLTIFKQVRRLMPAENIIYFGDTAHVPYGSKSKETVTEYSVNIARFLEQKKVKLILIACNTASALALATVRRHVSVPVLGVIEPGAKKALATGSKKIIVLGTESTVKSKAYPKTIKLKDKGAVVQQFACPLFVPLIEEGLTEDPITDLAIKKYIRPLKDLKPEAVILGCTHYPVIKNKISEFLGSKVILVDSAEAIAAEARDLLVKKKMLKTKGKAKVQVFASDSPERFSKLAANIIGGKLPKVKVSKFYI